MSEGMTLDGVAQRLAQALLRPDLPIRAKKAGERLHARLTSPVRVTLMGPAEAKKATIINAMVGREIVPMNFQLPSCEISGSETEHIRVTDRKGATREVQANDFLDSDGGMPSLVEFFAPDPILHDFSFLDIATDGSPDQLLAAAKWASSRTDIAVWVTPDFSDAQQELWQQMPEAMQNHCFLVPINTALDSTAEGNQSQAQSTTFDDRKFVAVCPVTLLTSADTPHGAVIDNLRDELRLCVDGGRQADCDQAHLFLKKYTDDPTPGSGKQNRDPTDADLDSFGSDALARSLEASLESEAGCDRTAVREQQSAILEIIESSARTMLETVAGEGDTAAATITAKCAESVQLMCDVTTSENPLYDTAQQAADYLVLLELESGNDSANDAVTALLQLKREVEVALVA